ncbi:phosphopantetheine-binding protein [Streptomyces sp. NPDC002073]
MASDPGTAPGPTACRSVGIRLDPTPPGTRLHHVGDTAYGDSEAGFPGARRAGGRIGARGISIDPADVEAVLTSHPRIARAAVTTCPDRHGIPQLVAHVTARADSEGGDGDGSGSGSGSGSEAEGGGERRDEAGPDARSGAAAAGVPGPQEIRTWLRTLLPDHLVPYSVTVLDRLPLTANGEIDERALPTPVPGAADGRTPHTPLEEMLRALFTELLAAPAPPAVDDDFFDLGGRSLLAARLASRVSTVLGTRVTVRDVFQSPTPALLAERLTTRGRRCAPQPAAAAPAAG